MVRSLPLSITSPLCVSTLGTGSCICRRGSIRLSSLVALCYHHPWADPPSWALEPVESLQTHRVVRISGGSAFSSSENSTSTNFGK
jgi:hypothetical protein